ncbi:MAG: hypothetical protein JW814_01260 [Candidatus Krumholzibacteriota bacterium]|nr:hypothetical protein [Candidatus Krumholzibacteriota bacterium]
MSKKRKNLIVVFSIVVLVILTLSISLRVILTKDRLIAMIMPRLEKAVDAEIEIGDIGIRFPFGFGVDVADLSFSRKLPGEASLSFTSEKITVDASLMGLIKRKPEIRKVSVKNGSLISSLPEKGLETRLVRFDAEISMRPVRKAYEISADISVDGVEVEKKGHEGKFIIERLRGTARIESNAAFDSVRVAEASVDVDDLIRMSVSGKVSGVAGKREISFEAQSDAIDAAPLATWIAGLDLGPFISAPDKKDKAEVFPARVTGGRLLFSASMSAADAAPGKVAAAGSVHLEKIVLEPVVIDMPVTIDGDISMADEKISSEKITASLGSSSVEMRFIVAIDSAMAPERADFACRLDLDAGELSAKLSGKEPAASGKIKADLEGGGRTGLLKALFPAPDSPVSPARLGEAWKSVELKGSVKIENARMKSEDGLVSISQFNGSARVVKGDIDKVAAGFLLNGSRYDLTASFKGFMPALAELAMNARKEEGAPLSKILDSAVNLPDISMRLTGRSFDLRPFTRDAAEKKKNPAAKSADPKKVETPQNALAGAAVLLLNSRIEARIDSLYSQKALFTAVDGKAGITTGRVRIDPLSLDYAGGKGAGTATINLRDPADIRSSFNLSFSGVKAGTALSSVSEFGSMISGEFSFRTEGDIRTGAGIDPLASISATGNASSTSGKIDLSKFISPVSKASGIDLAHMEKVDFQKWTGNYFIKNGRLHTEDWKIDSPGGNWDIKGSYGFDGTLDYKATVFLTPQMQKKIKDLDKYRDLVDLFRDEKGNLILDLDISGNSKSPKVSLDQGRAGKKAEEKLIDGIKKGIGDLLNKKK